MDAMNDIRKIRMQIEQHQAEQEQVFRFILNTQKSQQRIILW